MINEIWLKELLQKSKTVNRAQRDRLGPQRLQKNLYSRYREQYIKWIRLG
jgi:hypothetical protein